MSVSCLMCQSFDIDVKDSISRKDLEKLWNSIGRDLDENDLSRCNLHAMIDLYHCKACGFDFFNPDQAGDAAFYEKLSAENNEYYNLHRPEFDNAIEHAKSKGCRSILDIGCGNGSFLDLAKKSGFETHGMELNETAAAVAKKNGHTVISGILTHSFIHEHQKKYDLVTLFQVVEHLSDPISVLNLAKQLLSTGGTLMFSVPNREGQYLLYPLDPHQWPPHHISRWRIRDFDRVAEKLDMRLYKYTGDFLYGQSIVDFFIRNSSANKILGRKNSKILYGLVSGLSLLYRALALKKYIRFKGLSIHCYLMHKP